MKQCMWVVVGLLTSPLNCTKYIYKALYNTVETVLFHFRNVGFTGPTLKWDYGGKFQRQCSHILAA